MPNNLTDAEVKKALDICASEHLGCEDNCPYVTNSDSCSLKRDALDLINRQEAKLKALQMDNKQLETDNFNANMNCEHLQAEIERLKTEKLILSQKRFNMFERLEFADKIKAEAYKEFAERLHCHCESIINQPHNENVRPLSWKCAYEEFDNEVDNLLNELVGDGDAK